MLAFQRLGKKNLSKSGSRLSLRTGKEGAELVKEAAGGVEAN